MARRTAKPPLNPSELRAGEGVGFGVWLVFAALSNALGWGAVYGAYGEVSGWPWLIIAVFPAAGLVVLRVAWKLGVQIRRWGRAKLTLDPPQPTVAEPFAATMRLEGAAEPPPREWWAALLCERTDSGESSSRVSTIWRQDVEATCDGTTVRLVFTPGFRNGVPMGRPPPPTGEIGGGRGRSSRIGWRLLVWAAGVDPPKQFEPVLGPPREEPNPDAAALLEEAAASARRARDPSATVRRLADRGVAVSARPERGVIRQRPRRHRGLAVGLLVLGALFGFGGFALLSTAFARGDEPVDTWVAGAAFTIAAATALAVAVHKMRHEATTTWDATHIRVAWRHLLGRGVEEIERARIASLVPVVRYTSGAQASHVVQQDALALLAVTDDGRKLPLADGIVSRPDADTLLEMLARAWDVPTDRVGSAESAQTGVAGARNLVWTRTWPRLLACGIGLAAASVLGAATLRMDFGGETTSSFSIAGVTRDRGDARPPGGVRAEPTGAGAGTAPDRTPRGPARPPPPDPAALPGIPPGTDLSGEWTLTLPAGFVWPVTLVPAGRGRYRLRTGTVFGGVYQVRAGNLEIVARDDPRLEGFVWRGDGAGGLVLTETAPVARIGQDYRGATLRRAR